jgi:large subunit ribosomal protein L30
MAKQVKLTQIRSTIHAVPKHKLTIKAIGFRHTYDVLIKNDSPALRGMIHQVRHLVKVEEVK